MSRRLRRPRALAAIGAVTVMLTATLVLATTGAQAAGGGACQVQGSATFAPNGPGTNANFSYSFTGNLTGCQSNITGAPTAGAIGAGVVVTKAVSITQANGVIVQGTAQYQEPVSTGSGNIPVNSCPAGATSGTAIIDWTGGTTTVASYTTQSAGAAVNLQGTVIPSVALSLVPGTESPAGTAPSTYTVNTNEAAFPSGNGAQGALTFTTSNPQQCTTAAGLTTADLQGVIGVGSA